MTTTEEMYFQRDEEGKIVKVVNSEYSIPITWSLKNKDELSEEDYQFTIDTANFIVEIACSCRGIRAL